METSQNWRPSVYAPITGNVRRRRPGKGLAAHLLEIAEGCCAYCTLPIKATTYRRNRLVRLRLEWDHFVPYSYLVANPVANWQVSCHVCNRLKTAGFYNSVEIAAQVILRMRERLGYESIPDAWDRLLAEPYSPWVRPAGPTTHLTTLTDPVPHTTEESA